jgi:hypothetical protein
VSEAAYDRDCYLTELATEVVAVGKEEGLGRAAIDTARNGTYSLSVEMSV